MLPLTRDFATDADTHINLYNALKSSEAALASLKGTYLEQTAQALVDRLKNEYDAYRAGFISRYNFVGP